MEKTVLLIFFFITTILHSCEKKEDPPKPTRSLYMSEELKSYYFFPKGSWWVYKRIDTTAEIYDTATVVRSESKMIFDSHMFPYEWEMVDISIEHSYYDSPDNYISPRLNVVMRNDGGFVDRISMSSPRKLFKSLPYFFSVPIDSTSMDAKCNIPETPTLIDRNNLSIHNRLFKRVVHLKYGVENFKYELWIAQNFGIIKYFNVGDSTEWELINYEIKN